MLDCFLLRYIQSIVLHDNCVTNLTTSDHFKRFRDTFIFVHSAHAMNSRIQSPKLSVIFAAYPIKISAAHFASLGQKAAKEPPPKHSPKCIQISDSSTGPAELMNPDFRRQIGDMCRKRAESVPRVF